MLPSLEMVGLEASHVFPCTFLSSMGSGISNLLGTQVLHPRFLLKPSKDSLRFMWKQWSQSFAILRLLGQVNAGKLLLARANMRHRNAAKWMHLVPKTLRNTHGDHSINVSPTLLFQIQIHPCRRLDFPLIPTAVTSPN